MKTFMLSVSAAGSVLMTALIPVGAGLTIVSASSAQAQDFTCQSGYTCFWAGPNETGKAVEYDNKLNGGHWVQLPPQLIPPQTIYVDGGSQVWTDGPLGKYCYAEGYRGPTRLGATEFYIRYGDTQSCSGSGPGGG